VLHEGELRAIGESQEAHNLYPRHVERIAREPLQVIAQHVNLRGRTLRWLIGQLDTTRTYSSPGSCAGVSR
jgi:inner membrane protein